MGLLSRSWLIDDGPEFESLFRVPECLWPGISEMMARRPGRRGRMGGRTAHFALAGLRLRCWG